MRITDIIRGILDQVDLAVDQKVQEPLVQEPMVVIAPVEEPAEQQPDLLSIIQQLAGVATEPEYANQPQEMTAPIGAAYPKGDDMHHSKNPADIRTNAPSMYPNFQAKQ
ncbi:hypothetical protein UFOVP112_295 [uncultured Caudovirales phage]|uniref:Uncharacterized protein n=1 Tax=uncultured Caudovirales phage TaxID=2100421 RepID=A0A6J5L879_9CAUD|nr:hypothetical protein UFOVP112_295 [uncultured Caudovirales phage]